MYQSASSKFAHVSAAPLPISAIRILHPSLQMPSGDFHHRSSEKCYIQLYNVTRDCRDILKCIGQNMIFPQFYIMKHQLTQANAKRTCQNSEKPEKAIRIIL